MVVVVKNPPANAGDIRDVDSVPTVGRSPGGGMAAHSSILAWRIPWTEEPGRVQSRGLQRVKNHWSDLACTHASLNEVIRVDPKQYEWCLMKNGETGVHKGTFAGERFCEITGRMPPMRQKWPDDTRI